MVVISDPLAYHCLLYLIVFESSRLGSLCLGTHIMRPSQHEYIQRMFFPLVPSPEDKPTPLFPARHSLSLSSTENDITPQVRRRNTLWVASTGVGGTLDNLSLQGPQAIFEVCMI